MAKQKKRRIKNPVARNMDEFNRPVTHRDRKNDYKRSVKHKGQGKDPYFLTCFSNISFLYIVISILMLECLIQFRNNSTGGAWWPFCVTDEALFDNCCEYKIYGIIYTADTGPFRIALESAIQETTWNAISKPDIPVSVILDKRSNLS